MMPLNPAPRIPRPAPRPPSPGAEDAGVPRSPPPRPLSRPPQLNPPAPVSALIPGIVPPVSSPAWSFSLSHIPMGSPAPSASSSSTGMPPTMRIIAASGRDPRARCAPAAPSTPAPDATPGAAPCAGAAPPADRPSSPRPARRKSWGDRLIERRRIDGRLRDRRDGGVFLRGDLIHREHATDGAHRLPLAERRGEVQDHVELLRVGRLLCGGADHAILGHAGHFLEHANGGGTPAIHRGIEEELRDPFLQIVTAAPLPVVAPVNLRRVLFREGREVQIGVLHR